MPLGTYVADPNNVNTPPVNISGGYSAAELKALKILVRDNNIDTPPTATNSGNAYFESSLADNLTTGVVYTIRVTAANTGAATLAPGPTPGTTLTIKQLDNTTDIVAGMIQSRSVLRLYKTSTHLVLLNPYIGIATATLTGSVRLDDAIDATSGEADGIAATPAAARLAYNRGSAGVTAAAAAQLTADDADTAAGNAQTAADNAQSDADDAQVAATAANNNANGRAPAAGDASQVFAVASAGSSTSRAIRRTDYATAILGGTMKASFVGGVLTLSAS